MSPDSGDRRARPDGEAGAARAAGGRAKPGGGAGAPALAVSARNVLANAVRLTSDGRREGQEAFTASPFSRLAMTHVLSMAGDALVTLALAGSLFFDISPHAARGRVALSLVLTMTPFAIVAPFLGPAIDRHRGGKRMIVLFAAAGRAVACLFMARYIHGLLLFPAAFVTLVCSKAYVVAKSALVPTVVERPEDLVEANSKLAVAGGIVGFVAAIPGVAILKLFSGVTVLRVDSVVFVLCAVSALRIQPRRPGVAVEPTSGETVAPPAEARAGPSAGGPLPPGVLQLAAVAMASLRFCVGFLTFLVAFAFRRSHAPAWWYGIVLAGSVGGNLIGAAVAPMLRGKVKEQHILAGAVGAVGLMGLLVMQLSGLHRYPAAALLAATIGLAAGSAKLAFDSLVQQEVPPASQGRAFARFEAAFQLVWVVGGLVPVVIAMSLNAGFIVTTTITAAAGVVYEGGS
ncbi:MAG TPA: MFS transporter, partial [Acidimicrobiales bacterium]|nr:MFS transporter [Acidimicrobiales bacterium]